MILAICAIVAVCSAFKATGEVTTSGVSSGAIMASQLHFAYSSVIKGAGIFAGGPYYCALGLESKAILDCMTMPINIQINKITNFADSKAKSGLIDPLTNLKDSKVFIWAGTKDTTVNPDVGRKGEDLYRHYGANIKTKYDLVAAHTTPTIDPYLGSCLTAESPYISYCNYDGPFEALNHLS